MRILIHASGDEELVKIANEGGDLHMPGVRIFYPDFDSLPEDEQKSKRNAGKNTNFAIGYGAAWPKACKTANIPESEAPRISREYKARFPKFCGLMQENIRRVKEQGYIETAFGRRLYIPRNEGYVGTNFYGQGTGAELMKRGTIRVSNYLDQTTAGEMGIILTIHDEMIIQCPRKRIGDAKPILRECCRLMTDFPGVFRIPFVVECKVATYDWQHKEKFSLA
jgi:DNA polymerase-1